MLLLCVANVTAQKKWKSGILVDEFIFDTVSFPQSHASTIAETPDGLIAEISIGICRLSVLLYS